MEINKYPDGSSYATTDVELIGKINHEIIFRTNTYEDLWHLNQYIDAFYNFNKQKPTVIIPNLIDAQADRRFAKDQSSGLKLVCKFLNNMKAKFKIFHPHNPEVVEALMDNVEIIDNSQFINKVLDLIPDGKQPYGQHDDMILMSSDAGGFKPLIKLCDKINWQGETTSANKSRQWDGKKSKLIQTLPSFDLNKDILIIDDISVYGGTFKGLAKLLKDVGHQGKLYLAVSHMTVENLRDDPVTNYFDKVFTTNSKFDNYFKLNRKKDGGVKPQNLEIIKLF